MNSRKQRSFLFVQIYREECAALYAFCIVFPFGLCGLHVESQGKPTKQSILIINDHAKTRR